MHGGPLALLDPRASWAGAGPDDPRPYRCWGEVGGCYPERPSAARAALLRDPSEEQQSSARDSELTCVQSGQRMLRA